MAMFSPQLLNHFQQPRNVGEVEQASAVAEVENPVCGDVLRLTLKIEADRIVAARFRAQGCVASIACASLRASHVIDPIVPGMTELITGKQAQEAAELRASDLVDALGGVPEGSGHAAELAIDALKMALAKSP